MKNDYTRNQVRAFSYIGAVIGYGMAVYLDADWKSFWIFAVSMAVWFGIFTAFDKWADRKTKEIKERGLNETHTG